MPVGPQDGAGVLPFHLHAADRVAGKVQPAAEALFARLQTVAISLSVPETRVRSRSRRWTSSWRVVGVSWVAVIGVPPLVVRS
jgi:hypothetical protein